MVSGGLKGVEAVEAKAKSFKARMVVSLFLPISKCILKLQIRNQV